MKKKLLLPIIGMLSLVASAAGETAHVYEIRPWNNVAKSAATGAQSTVESPIKGGDTFYFLVRLLNSDWKNLGAATNSWEFTTLGSYEAKWATQPPHIGIVVSGVTVPATIEACIPDSNINTKSSSVYYTDIICSYTVKPGDFALPVLLASDSAGTPVDEDHPTIYLDGLEIEATFGKIDIRVACRGD